jgi:hypothetical protein
MRSLGQWDGLEPNAANRWLDNFSTGPLKYFAARILRGLVYYSERDIGTLLKEGLVHQVLGRLVREEYQLKTEFSCYPSRLTYELKRHTERTLLVPLVMSDNPAESGPGITRIAERLLGFSRDNICYPDQLIDRNFSEIDDVVIIDDNLGSGQHFRKFWDDFANRDGVAISRFLTHAAKRVHHLVLVAVEPAFRSLVADYSDVRFAAAQLIPGDYGVFAPNSVYWPDTEEQTEAYNAFQSHLSSFDIPISGFSDMTFAVVLHDTIPDWCLPALWLQRPDWTPLITRKNSK